MNQPANSITNQNSRVGRSYPATCEGTYIPEKCGDRVATSFGDYCPTCKLAV